MSGPWDDKKIAYLRDRWEKGDSGAVIGRALQVSKTSVIAKARRLGLESRPSPIKRLAADPPAPVTQTLPVAPRLLKPVKIQPPIFGRPGQCEFLSGKDKPWKRCDRSIDYGLYCREHAARCYAPVPARRVTAP